MKKNKSVLDMAKNITALQKVINCEDCGEMLFVRATSRRTRCDKCAAKHWSEEMHKPHNIEKQIISHRENSKECNYHKVGKKYEHREKMEQYLGRKLEKNEVVHHKDGNRHNNDLDNLEVMSRSEHTRLHNRLRVQQKLLLVVATLV